MKGMGMFFTVEICLLFSLVHASALIPPGLLYFFIMGGLGGGGALLHCISAVFCLIAMGMLWLLMAVLCSGIAARLLRLRYCGDHKLDTSIPDVRRWVLHMVVYLPVAFVLDAFHLYPLKTVHLRLFGATIGKRVIAGAMVTDPSLLTVGDDSVLAGFSTIMGHAVERGRIRFGRVTIGKRCGVGVRTVVLPGAVFEDGALAGAQSLVLSGMVIPAGETYLGVPARRILGRKTGEG
jgi:acetyltransferase-like isoleucine patch superfamily enzyme